MSPRKMLTPSKPARQHARLRYPPHLSVRYEGRDVDIRLSSPDISAKGMFINSPSRLPEGAVLKVTFLLPRRNVMVVARCEVRFCLPGVGVGVEFIDISPETEHDIEQEIESLQESAKSHLVPRY